MKNGRYSDAQIISPVALATCPAKAKECYEAMRKGFADYAPGMSVMIKSSGSNMNLFQ